MEYRRLGNSDLEISRVILGTWALGGWMWGGTEQNDPINTIRAAFDRGITTIDTAPIYGFGLSEELVGKAIRGVRDQVVIATKFGMRWDLEEGEYWFDTETLDGKAVRVYKCARKKSILEECDRSLQRLGVDVIDLYQCHWPDKTTPVGETIEALLELQEKGKIRWFGVSNFDVPLMQECLKHGRITSLQPPYSLLRRDIEKDVLPFCQRENIGAIVYSPMYRGLLTGKIIPGYRFGPGDTRAKDPWFQGERLQKVKVVIDRVLRPIAETHGATPAQAAVAWCLAQPGVTGAIVGARTPEQALANARAADLHLSEEEVKTIGDAFAELLAAYS